MAISRTESTGRLLITLPVIFAGLFGLFFGLPFKQIVTEQQWWLGVFRAAYGGLVLIRLQRSLPGAALMHGWRETARIRRIYRLWMVVAFMMTIGLLTPLALILHWWLGATIQRKNRVYSVEDVLFRAAGFCLLFLQTHLAFSLDACLNWHFGLIHPSVLGVNFMAWTVALLMFSASLEKFWSPIWHKGLGFYYFMSLPHLVKPAFSWMNRSRPLSVVLSWITVFAELLLVPAMFMPWLRWPLYLVLGGFALSLFVVVDISFIGQLTLLLIAGLALLDWAASNVTVLLPNYQTWSSGEWLLFCFLATLYILSCISASGLVKLRSGVISHIMAWTTHFRPFTVFVEIHFFGLYMFRLIGRFKSGETRRLLDVFTDKGSPGRLQIWRPRTFSGCMYRFTDYCIAVLENLEERRVQRETFVEDIAYAGFEELSAEDKANLEAIDIQVRVFDPAEDFEPDTSGWLSPEWIPIGYVNGFPDHLKLTNTAPPPRYKKTYRWPVTFQ